MIAEFSHRSLQGARATRRRLLAATVLVVALLMLDALTGGSVRSLVRTLASDIWQGSAAIRSSITDTGYFKSHRALAEENASLRAALAQYQEKAAGYDVLSSENTQLRAALHFAEAAGVLTAPVVSSFRTSPYGTFMIGAGTADPIAKGDSVESDGGFVIGTLSDVLSHVATVREIFTAGTRTDALVDATAVTLIGDGGGNAHASVPLGVSVAAGDPVVSNQFDGKSVGVVGSVVSSASSADQTIYVRLPVNLSSLRFVYVIHR